jgi:hypothetical protein
MPAMDIPFDEIFHRLMHNNVNSGRPVGQYQNCALRRRADKLKRRRLNITDPDRSRSECVQERMTLPVIMDLTTRLRYRDARTLEYFASGIGCRVSLLLTGKMVQRIKIQIAEAIGRRIAA